MKNAVELIIIANIHIVIEWTQIINNTFLHHKFLLSFDENIVLFLFPDDYQSFYAMPQCSLTIMLSLVAKPFFQFLNTINFVA